VVGFFGRRNEPCKHYPVADAIMPLSYGVGKNKTFFLS